MKTNDTRQNAHAEVDHIFKDLLPAKGMAERPAQAALSHRMLDAMLDGGIALCDAGTGIGKTYAYLVAGTVFHRWRAANGQLGRPLLISTSSIALQTAVVKEYLPFLSCLLMADGMLDRPLRAVIRKGKAHYVCDERLIRRLGHVDLRKKNRQAAEALLSLKNHLDLDLVEHLSGYDRERVCVPSSAPASGRRAGTGSFWRRAPPITSTSRSATTICCWPTRFTEPWADSPSSRSMAASS